MALGAAAVAVGLSRVYLGVHWLLDITGAWALAAIWLALAVPLLGRLPFQAKPETTRHSTVGGVNRLG
ncbi:phosphatase PAP2 family protein [Kitasatospora gansuensis]